MRIKSVFAGVLIISLGIQFAIDASGEAEVPSDGRALTLEQAVQTAIANNPELEAARQNVEAARGRILTAEAFPNPEVEIEGSPSIPKGEYGFSVGIDQPVPIRGKISKRIAVAKEELALAEWELHDTERRLIAEVKRTFRNAQVLGERMGLANSLAGLNQRLFEIAKARFNKGEVSELDVHQFEIELKQRQQEVKVLLSEKTSALLELSRLLNITYKEDLVLSSEIAGELELPLLTSLLNVAQNRPDIKASQAEVSALEKGHKLILAEQWDDPKVGFFFSREKSAFDEPTELSDIDSFIGARITVPLPLFYRKEGELSQNLAGIKSAESRVLAETVRVDREVRDAYQKVSAQIEILKNYQAGIIEMVEKNVELAEKAYSMGLTNVVQLIQVQQQFFSLKDARLNALRVYYQALSDLEGAVNMPLSEVPNVVTP